MAATRIIPIHAGRRSVARALRDVTDYMENPAKTNGGEFITAYECVPETADAEFLLAKSRYLALTGRTQKSDVIAYHLRQSFKPGEITPEEANRIGVELVTRFTKGKHAFIVCTHTDRRHIHNHIVWNSTALDCRCKWRDFFRSGRALRKLGDLICAENGLSVIENPKPGRGKHYGAWLGDGKPPTFNDRLKQSVDEALLRSPQRFEDFITLIRESGITAERRGSLMRFKLPDQKQFTRLDSLSGDYTEEAIRERIEGRRIVTAPGGVSAGKTFARGAERAPRLLIDIEAKLREGKGPGFERWAKIHNLKQMAKTLIYLQEQGLDDYSLLKEKTAAATEKFNGLSDRVKDLDAKLTDNAALQKQIVTYAKTRQTYADYRKSGYSKAFRTTHETDILLHQTAKKYFDELGLKKLPTVASLREEYAPLLDEKKQAYAEFRTTRNEMRELLVAKSNVDRLLNITDERPLREPKREER